MIDITPGGQIHFPALSIARDKSVVVYKSQQEFTTVIGRKGSIGQPIAPYLGMKVIDQDGNLFEVREARKGRDLGPLYPGLSLSRFLFRTRRVEANLSVSFLGKISLDETKHLVAEDLPSICRSLASVVGIATESLPESVGAAQTFQELFSLLDPR
jgi:hypothetical protein